MISVLSQRINLSYGRPGTVQESGPSSLLRATQGGRTSRPICQTDPGGRLHTHLSDSTGNWEVEVKGSRVNSSPDFCGF